MFGKTVDEVADVLNKHFSVNIVDCVSHSIALCIFEVLEVRQSKRWNLIQAESLVIPSEHFISQVDLLMIQFKGGT